MPSNKKVFDKLVSKTKIYLVIIAILLILLCIYEINLITPAIILYAIILMYAYWTNNKRKVELSEHIKDLTLTVDSAAKSTLINSPFPLVIIETDGNIIWKSSKFIHTFANIDINNYLNNIVKELKLEIKNGSEENKKELEELIKKQVKIGDRTYKVVGEYVKSKDKVKNKVKEDEYMATLYFIDETQYIHLQEDYQNSKICVGIIMIDNYEEIIQRLSDEDKPQMIAKIEKAIYDWAGEVQALIIKQDRDTFVMIMEQKYISVLEENKFNLLDTIKEINIPGKMQSTLSIALTTEGDSNYQKYKTAQATIDIALGRGGDQAILRKDGKYTFFGGRTQEVEKRTKVKARIVAHALEELMSESKNVIIMGHSNTDIDAMGSAFGIYRFAKTVGKEEVYMVNETYGISLENFLQEVQKEEEYKKCIVNKEEALNKIDEDTLLVIVDTHKANYVEVPELLEKTNKIVIIDHHRRSTDFIENSILTFQEVYASSAAELVTELIEYSEQDIRLTEIERESLYAGIMMDTKNFTFKTGVRTFEAAAYLRKCGVDIIKVKKWFQSDLETYNKISEIIAKTEIMNESIAISIYDKEDANSNIICAKAADELLTISNITASFVMGKMGDKVCISGRSIGDINVQLILEKLGGGGHITLAGAQVEGMDIEEVKQELMNRIHEYFSEIEG